MKRFFAIGMMAIAMMLCFAPAKAQNSPRQGQALAAVRTECGIEGRDNARLEANLYAQGICIVSGNFEIYEVRIVYTCPPNVQTLCLPAPPETVAYVTFECDGDVSVQCL